MLIGCGHIGQQHIEDIYYRENVQIVAVIDTDVERARQFARRYHAKHFGDDYRIFLESKEIDIAVIATYADSHLSILRDCLKSNVHVLCEKPIATTLREGLEFYRLAQHASSKVLVAHILRHNRSYQKIAQMIGDGAIGDLKVIRMVQNHHALDWNRYKRLMDDCSPVVDCGVHYIDIMQWVSRSRIVEVGGFSARIDADAPRDNYGVMTVRMANGCVGYYEAGWSPNMASQNQKEFIGTKGRITLTLHSFRHENQEEGDLVVLYIGETGEYKTINIPSKYKDMYAQFSQLTCMIENDSPLTPMLDDVFSAFCTVLTAEQAIRQHAFLPCPTIDEVLRSDF